MTVRIGKYSVLALILLFIAIIPRAKASTTENVRISVIITADSLQHARDAAIAADAEITHELSIINAIGAIVEVDELEDLAAAPHVISVSENAPVVTANYTQTVQDTFSTLSYANSNGTGEWRTDWVETNDDDDPSSGSIRIFWDALVMKESSRGIKRTVDLSAASDATLSFEYGLWSFDDENDYVSLQIKHDEEWVELDRFIGPGTDWGRKPVSYDISPYMGSNTRIRFVTSDVLSSRDSFSFDNFEVRYTVGDEIEDGEQRYADYFDSNSYSANNGSIAWNSPWVEEGDHSDSYGGDIVVHSGSLLLKDGNRSVRRTADLTDARSADLTITTQIESAEYEDEYVTLDISTDYGQSWTELDRFAGPADQIEPETTIYDLTPFVGDEVMVRFASSAEFGNADNIGHCILCGWGGYDRLYIDDVQIDFTTNELVYEEEQETAPASTMVNANELHDVGITGDGVTVAIIDSGFLNNPDLEIASNGLNRILTQYDAIQGLIVNAGLGDIVQSDDNNGHGTHIASIIANSKQDDQGRSMGVAPDVNLAIYKAFSAEGQGSYADVIRALDQIIAQKDELNIRIINMSFYSTPQSHYWEDPLNQAVMRAWEAGIVVITGAGNTGPDALSIGVPGNVPYVITVGAYTDNYTPFDETDDYIPSFSSAGPTYDGFVKPEVIAPGAHILGLLGSNSKIIQNNPHLEAINGLFPLSGTSMSSAVTSGIVALMLQDDPSLTPDDVKCRLIDSARVAVDAEGNPAYSIFQQGAGAIDAQAALASTATGCANGGLDISADLNDIEHYVGPASRSEAGDFILLDQDGNEVHAWDGAYSNTDGFYAWTGGFYAWTGGFYAWTGGFYAWTGGFYAWTGNNVAWNGGFYAWTGNTLDPNSATSAITYSLSE